MQLLQFHEYSAHRASVMNTIVIDGRETGCMKLEGLGEPVMCIIDPIIAVVLMLKLLKTLQQSFSQGNLLVIQLVKKLKSEFN